MRALSFRVALVISFCVSANPSTLIAQARDTSYVIEGGSYSGISVAIRKSAATRRGSKFWRLATNGDRRIVGWNPSRFPVGVAFKPNRGISADDSIAFWNILGKLQTDLGLQIFHPAVITPDDDPDDVIVVDTKAMASDDGVTYVTWSRNGAVYDARVFFRSTSKLHEANVVTHEMMHALGFGHTSEWLSIMNERPLLSRLSEEDVAYTQLALHSREESERIDVWERLALAVEREIPTAVKYCASVAAPPTGCPLPSASCCPERRFFDRGGER